MSSRLEKVKGISIAKVQPLIGKDKKESFPSPNLFKTVRKLGAQYFLVISNTSEITFDSLSGTTN